MRGLARRAALVLAALGLVGGLSVATGSQAFASGQICAQGGSGYCLNDWGNGPSGTPVKMYTGGVSNDNFGWQTVIRCEGGDAVTGDCPFTDSGFDSQYAGDAIIQLKYNGSAGGCVATDHAGDVQMGVCNNTSTGAGGSFGTLWVDDLSGHLISVGMTNYVTVGLDTPMALVSGGSIGVQAITNNTGWSNWGGIP